LELPFKLSKNYNVPLLAHKLKDKNTHKKIAHKDKYPYRFEKSLKNKNK
jgi:hypothetical protein